MQGTVQLREREEPGSHSLPPCPPWPARMKSVCHAPCTVFPVQPLLPEAGTRPHRSCRPPLLIAPPAPSSLFLGHFLTGHVFHLLASLSGFWLSPCVSNDQGLFRSDTVSVGAATRTGPGVGLVAAAASRTWSFCRVSLEEEGRPPVTLPHGRPEPVLSLARRFPCEVPLFPALRRQPHGLGGRSCPVSCVSSGPCGYFPVLGRLATSVAPPEASRPGFFSVGRCCLREPG